MDPIASPTIHDLLYLSTDALVRKQPKQCFKTQHLLECELTDVGVTVDPGVSRHTVTLVVCVYTVRTLAAILTRVQTAGYKKQTKIYMS